MQFTFQRAVRRQRKARIGIVGPSGSGKTYTSLQIATGIAGPNGRIAVIDTENYSSSLYADEFTFDVLGLDTFAPATYVSAIKAAEAAGYDVLIIDSLSHAWIGKEGALEQKDKAAVRARGNTFAAWREVTPQHNALVDAIVRSKMHVIATMRAKTEYIVEKDERTGKTIPRKVGLAPVQREGMEYEFDIVADMDHDHRFIVSKSRASFLTDAVLDKPGPELGEKIRAWFESGEASPHQPVTTHEEHQKALSEYHEAAASLIPEEAEREEFLRYAVWAGVRDKGLALPDISQISPANIRKITSRLAGQNGETLRDLLDGWRSEYASRNGEQIKFPA